MSRGASRRILARTVAAKLLAEPSERRAWLQRLAAYLLDHNMTDDAELIMNDIARELLAQGGQLNATVTSARPLTHTLRDELAQILKAQTGARAVSLSEQTDPGILGGLIARTPDHQLDVSVRARLKQLAAIK